VELLEAGRGQGTIARFSGLFGSSGLSRFSGLSGSHAGQTKRIKQTKQTK
jgi:hypothetical protein